MAKKPFNDAFGRLKSLSPRRDPREERPSPPTPPPAPAPPREPTEAELWSNATQGARRVARGPDTIAPPAPRPPGGAVRHPDLEAIDALRALVSGEAPFDLSDSDEYIEGRVSGLDHGVVRKLRRGDFAVQGHVDLHGLTREEAKQAVDRFLRASRQAGKRCVLVVHGRGLHSKDQLPVLKDALRGWLGSARFGRHVLAFATARPVDGGAGALYVLLRRPGR